MATFYELRSLPSDPKRRLVVVGKTEKPERDRRHSTRPTRDEYDRNVPDVDDLRRTRSEYYGRTPSQRKATSYRPLDQELKGEGDRKSKRKVAPRVVEVKRVTKDERERDGGGSGRHRRKRSTTAPEDDAGYVYRSTKDPPARSRSVRNTVDEVREYRRDSYAEETYEQRGKGSGLRSRRSREDLIYAPEAPAPPPIHASPEKSSKLSRSSTRIGSGSHRTRSSTVRSRSTSRSRRPGSVKVRHFKAKDRDGRPPMPSVPEDNIPLSPPSREKRRSSFFGGFFAGKAKVDTSTRMVECLTCCSDVSSSKAATLGCGHTMCHRCLKRIFTMSVTDPQHMPPRCCTSDHIPLKHVSRLFDDRFKARWNRKFEEYTTKNRVYCPARGCGTWIPPQDLRPSRIDPKRSIGICRRCNTRTCGKCGRKWHTNADCTKVEKSSDAREFAEMAAASGWQRCYNCTATVELKEGCNHMTCRCGAEFCMICGVKWKGCDCPWFNATQMQDGDRLDMPNDIGEDRGHANGRAYRREQERRDEEVARRMQGLEIDDWEEDRSRRPRTATMERTYGGNDTQGFGNMAGHYLNDNFVQRASRILTGTYNTENRDAADRLVREIRTDRAPPLPRTAVLDPVRDYHEQARRTDDRPRGDRSRPSSQRRTTSASDIHDGAGIPTRRPSARRHRATASQATSSERRDVSDDRRRSVLAGLATQPGESRVDQWRNHVKEGEPDFGPAG